MNPDLSAFLASFNTETVFGQVLVWYMERGFELRHRNDRAADAGTLALLKGTEVRAWAQTTARGAFRPLKSAPNLRTGWRALAADGQELDLLLHYLYPGALADWFAAQSAHPPITSYREFTGRQTGMYRITTMLNDPIAGAAIRACCHADFCRKRRLWSVEGLAPDHEQMKSDIPCLEPCALMLEFARKVMRLEQNAAPMSEAPKTNPAEADFDASNNPRRARFSLEKQALTSKSNQE